MPCAHRGHARLYVINRHPCGRRSVWPCDLYGECTARESQCLNVRVCSTCPNNTERPVIKCTAKRTVQPAKPKREEKSHPDRPDLGPPIGKPGAFRCVYMHPNQTDCVVKVAKDRADEKSIAHNRNEFAVWDMLRDKPEGLLLCPCISISVDGRELLMQRAEPLHRNDTPPEPQPWMRDAVKSINWGRLPDGRVVLIDYGDQNMRERVAAIIPEARS